MSRMSAAQVVIGRLIAGLPPLDPVDQDPDQIRDQACRLVEGSSVCEPPAPDPTAPDVTPPRFDEPNRGGGDVGSPASLLTLLLWAALIGLLLLLVYLIVRTLLERSGRGSSRRGKDETDDDDDDGGNEQVRLRSVQVDRSVEPTGWRADAERFRREGRFRDALRCRYRALVGDLARRGLIDEIPGRTTGEERAQLDVVAPRASDPFRNAADLFDDAWYGNADVTSDDDDEFQRLEADVLAMTAGRQATIGSAP